MSLGESGKKRWTERREQREPTLYDEWMKEEASQKRRSSNPVRASTASPRPRSGTVRASTPEHAAAEEWEGGYSAGEEVSDVGLPARLSSVERVGPHSTTFVGGPAALAGSSPEPPAVKPRKLVKDRIARVSTHGSPSGRNGSDAAGMLARNTSKGSARHMDDDRGVQSTSRSRAKTLEASHTERTSMASARHSRARIGSVNMRPASNSGVEFLASVPAEASPPSALPIQSITSGHTDTLDYLERRSVSPSGSTAGLSYDSSHSGTRSKRILHLMRTLQGRYQSNVVFRRKADKPWIHGFCYIEEDTAELVYAPKSPDEPHRTLLSSLKGCRVNADMDGNTPIVHATLPHADMEIYLKLLTQVDYDSWYAAFLHWSTIDRDDSSLPSPARTGSFSGRSAPPQPPPRTSSAKKQRRRNDSAKGERRKSASQAKDAPVIKIGKMIFWDMTGYGNVLSHTSSHDRPSSGRPQAQRTPSNVSRQWRRINGQLRENGELKLSVDADNSLISIVQLSQLSRCAIQRLDSSVMDDPYCIAIYPQYTSTSSEVQPDFVRPIFLSLENRVLYEVWFVLLRAFTIPQLYGPSLPDANAPGNDDTETGQGLENMLATKTTDMFRMERSLNIRIVEGKMYPIMAIMHLGEQSLGGVHARSAPAVNAKAEQSGYYAEILLDNETRGKTIIKYDGSTPLWGETFEFLDLPPVLNSASVVIKRRLPESHRREHHEPRPTHEVFPSTSDHQFGWTGLGFDVVCGKVEIYLQELNGDKELEKWWPVVNSYNQQVGEVFIRARASEGVILMARDYEPLVDILQRFENGITAQIAQMVPGELKRISDNLLDIFQVSGKASEWLMALVEEEIDGVQKTPITKLRLDRRSASDAGLENSVPGGSHADRELIVRDMNKHAALEANLLFRGNTLLTKSLDTYMRRIGKEYLEESVGPKLREINAQNPDCEVDPSRISHPSDMTQNWRRLVALTQEVWRAIVTVRHRCPIELRIIFRHIRACAEDRYGDFLRTVMYSSVSGFLFLRFFCPAVLNPKLFGLMKEDVQPNARRAFTLIAKSLQTLANLASFGSKETWMEPMNGFLSQARGSFKSLIDDVCYVPLPLSVGVSANTGGLAPAYPPETVSAEANLSYTTPITIMARLPPTSREGFPSLPFLIDQPRAFAELVQLWLEATTGDTAASDGRDGSSAQAEIVAAIESAGPQLVAFHEICTTLHKRTQDCLSRAERAERPSSASSFRWDELIDQLKTDGSIQDGDMPYQASLDSLADDLVKSPPSFSSRSRDWDVASSDAFAGRQSTTRPLGRPRPNSAAVLGDLHEGLRRAQLQSQGSESASASASNISSGPSSDTERTNETTALPSYEKELRHRDRRVAAKQQIQQHVAAARIRESEKDKRKVRSPIVSALRKKNQRESKMGPAGAESTNNGL